MKKIGVILAIIAIVALAGCPSTGKSGGGGEPFVVDLNTLTAVKALPGDKVGPPTGLHVRNADPFTKNYDDLLILFPQFPVDITQFQRVTVVCKYFGESGTEMAQADTRAMVSFIYDLDGDWRGPAMGAGPNTPLKEMNVGGFSSNISTDRGMRMSKLSRQPAAILFQNSDISVKFIELTALVFHNGNYEAPAE
ncbi:MAG: hypothetical protein LBI28_10685 [Treponema sp.]|jgi:hypothetical protein|nr:hypothetical protein [Treponema sp.]